jgi:hypothetical protein
MEVIESDSEQMDVEVNDASAKLVDLSSDSKLSSGSNLPWVEKYRPSSLDDLIAHEDIIAICE